MRSWLYSTIVVLNLITMLINWSLLYGINNETCKTQEELMLSLNE